MEKKKLIVAALAGLSGGCDQVDARPDWSGEDPDPDAAGLDAGSDEDTASDTETDADAGTDPDDDAGGCSGVTCYEAVGPAADDIGLLDLDEAGVIPPGRRVLSGSFSTRYAARISYRVLDRFGAEVDAGDLEWLESEDGEASFRISLPSAVGEQPFELLLYGTCLRDVRELDTFPARRYSGNRSPRDA